MAMLITEIDRNHRIRLFPVTEIHRSPYRGPVGFGGHREYAPEMGSQQHALPIEGMTVDPKTLLLEHA
jgi:hypothetical protein